MNQQELSRRDLLKRGAYFLSGIVFSCLPSAPREPTPTPTRRAIPTPLPPITPTPKRIEATPTFAPLEEHDLAIKALLEQAEKNETVKLESPLIKNILRFPWEGGQAYVATLDTLEPGGKTKIAAVLLSADCLYESFRRGNKLGFALFPGGLWRPDKRVNRLSAVVSLPSAVGVPVPILNINELNYKGATVRCEEETALERLKEGVSKIPWKEIPEGAGELIGWFTREFLGGLRRGLQTP